jgi:predicted dehydrogenase
MKQTELPELNSPPARPVRIGVVGLGHIAETCHLPALRFLQDQGWPVEVTGLCDINEEQRQKAQSVFPAAQLFADPDALLAADCIDALILLTPPAITPDLIRKGIERDLAVFTEKPVSHNPDELAELYALSQGRKVPVQVGYNRRYMPQADSFLKDRKPPSQVEARLWRANRKEPHFYTDTMVHAIDFLNYAFGPLQVDRTDWAPAVDGEILRPGVQVELSNASGLTCKLDVRPASGRMEESYTADGTELHFPVQGKETDTSEEELLILRGFVPQLAEFMRLVTGDSATSRCTLDDARQTCLLCDAVTSKLDS